MNRKQWSVLGALVPQAKSDPLGMYRNTGCCVTSCGRRRPAGG